MAVGWGKTIGREASYQLTNSLAGTLKEACLPVVSQGVCQRAFIDEGYTITNNMTCAGHASGGKVFCQGDSGDGFVFFDHQSKKWVLGGVVSWGSSRGCGLPNKYGVYVKVTKYVAWILRNIF
jgi:secreted trypsin-like serine protease